MNMSSCLIVQVYTTVSIWQLSAIFGYLEFFSRSNWLLWSLSVRSARCNLRKRRKYIYMSLSKRLGWRGNWPTLLMLYQWWKLHCNRKLPLSSTSYGWSLPKRLVCLVQIHRKLTLYAKWVRANHICKYVNVSRPFSSRFSKTNS